MERARAFYEALFGDKMTNPTPEIEMDMWAFPIDKESGMTSYGSGGMLVKMDGFAPGGGGTLVHFG